MQKSKTIQSYEFLNLIRNQKPFTSYFIFGPENYLRDKVIKAIVEKFKTPGSEDFDLTTLYGDDSSAKIVLEELEMLPFLAKNRIAILKNFDKMKLPDRNLIAKYLDNPVPTTIFIITAEKTDNRTEAFKKITQNSVNISCKKPFNANNIIHWLDNELEKKNISINKDAAEYFANSIELDYLIAANELEKLIIFTKISSNISLDDVKSCLEKSKMNSVFDLQNSIGKRDLKKTLQILENLFSFEEPSKIDIFIISMLTRFFTLLWMIIALQKKNITDSEISSRHLNQIFIKYRKDYLNSARNYNDKNIKKVFSLLLQADIDLKSLNIKEEIILETLIYNICRV